MSKYLAYRLEKDSLFLKTFFPDINQMEGTIIVLENENGYEKYKSLVGDPMQEQTLIIGDDNDRVILFFDHSPGQKVRNRVWPNVNIIRQFSYEIGCFIHKKCKPSNIPHHLKPYIIESIKHEDELSQIENKLEQLQIEDNFFSKNYTSGSMIPLKEVKKNSQWREEYRSLVDVKPIHICKSCQSKAHKGCCSEYSSSNRVKILMVLGWH